MSCSVMTPPMERESKIFITFLETAEKNLQKKLLNKFTSGLAEQEQLMPVLFTGHGLPINEIEDNEFSQPWTGMAKEIPKWNPIKDSISFFNDKAIAGSLTMTSVKVG